MLGSGGILWKHLLKMGPSNIKHQFSYFWTTPDKKYFKWVLDGLLYEHHCTVYTYSPCEILIITNKIQYQICKKNLHAETHLFPVTIPNHGPWFVSMFLSKNYWTSYSFYHVESYFLFGFILCHYAALFVTINLANKLPYKLTNG